MKARGRGFRGPSEPARGYGLKLNAFGLKALELCWGDGFPPVDIAREGSYSQRFVAVETSKPTTKCPVPCPMK